MPESSAILFCHCAGRDGVPLGVKDAVLCELRRRQTPFMEVGDLCARVADRDPDVLGLAASVDSLTIVACRPRAVRGLLRAAGLSAERPRLHVLDMRVGTAQAILDGIPVEGLRPIPVAVAADGDPAWFPVIDPDRCVQCRQCLSFCLFGVYTCSPEGKVKVTEPRACKNNCPACARICPEVAIMFPKLPAAEAPLDGSEIDGESQLKAQARIKAREVLGEDLHAALAERQRQARGRRLLKSAQERAEAERAAASGTEHNAGSSAGTEG